MYERKKDSAGFLLKHILKGIPAGALVKERVSFYLQKDCLAAGY
ncbi:MULTISPECIES: hypothetical protein [Cytobacillus]|uniref:Uncharacterized protein n=1 Tax=Cytobacillus firmus TaxID=1399 RepID=A0AA46SKP1_CYTFI|nr:MULTISPECIES: hypothetical protein [Cytobacillus]MCS0655348.1 hypothetical protein [Cytobacillus firmus]MCU1808001.1 hypothetical protein [Cytobacillus firmus]UYG97492.1 hypothetical protein OD459_10955 [Cytobacillus firmus]WHY34813.1 hypothetical protein QNH44_03350 [Cytobacillus firmus]